MHFNLYKDKNVYEKRKVSAATAALFNNIGVFCKIKDHISFSAAKTASLSVSAAFCL
jgi:hypothetical protein